MKSETRRTWLISALAIAVGGIGFFTGRLTQPETKQLRAETHKAPLIGIAASSSSESYVRAVRSSGGIPLLLPNTDGDAANVSDYLVRLDGLIMPGGADIPPSEYGEEPHETVKVLDDDRYQFEKALIHAWIKETDKPLLGICLGSQWINVASGGSLIQDIPSAIGEEHRSTTHAVTIEPDSRLGRILGSTEMEVNSYHHQSVNKIGKGLRVVAKSPDGIVEATEATDPNRFLVGVQWHPEKMMPDDKTQAKIFKAFVEAAAE